MCTQEKNLIVICDNEVIYYFLDGLKTQSDCIEITCKISW